jgi:hypothetical protein
MVSFFFWFQGTVEYGRQCRPGLEMKTHEMLAERIAKDG